MPDFAPGLPVKKDMGDLQKLPIGKLINYVVQEHNADRAKLHYDLRFGENELYSWAVRKGIPTPGEKHLAVRQPLHRGDYAGFEGIIEKGYGKGTVKTHDKGSLIVTHSDPEKIKFVVTHKKTPEYFTMVPKDEKNWILINTTPTNTQKFFGTKPDKIKLVSVPASEVSPLLEGSHNVQEKIDGAYQLFKIYSDKIEAISHRTSTSGRPIIHTYRVFGPKGAKPLNLPKELEGAVARGETYGERGGKAIPPQELGGLLNSSVERSLQMQKDRGIQIRNAIFSVNDSSNPIQVKELLKYLPSNFHLPRTAETGEEAKKLWDDIISKKNPLTEEGIVAWPKDSNLGGGKPSKVKVLPETDVVIRKVFQGKGKYDKSAGGFEYSHVGNTKIVGKVGTGFSDDLRKDMAENPGDYIGRIARIRSMGKLPSEALRAPSLIAIHEDYPSDSSLSKVAEAVIKLGYRRAANEDALETLSSVGGYLWDNKHHLKRKRKKKQMEKTAFVKEENGKFYVHSEKGKKLSRGYATKDEANKRLGQIEYFKHANS